MEHVYEILLSRHIVTGKVLNFLARQNVSQYEAIFICISNGRFLSLNFWDAKCVITVLLIFLSLFLKLSENKWAYVMIIIHFITVLLQDCHSSGAKQMSSLKPTCEMTIKALLYWLTTTPNRHPYTTNVVLPKRSCGFLLHVLLRLGLIKCLNTKTLWALWLHTHKANCDLHHFHVTCVIISEQMSLFPPSSLDISFAPKSLSRTTSLDSLGATMPPETLHCAGQGGPQGPFPKKATGLSLPVS